VLRRAGCRRYIRVGPFRPTGLDLAGETRFLRFEPDLGAEDGRGPGEFALRAGFMVGKAF
jgi:hypothetical protein